MLDHLADREAAREIWETAPRYRVAEIIAGDPTVRPGIRAELERLARKASARGPAVN